MKSTLTSHRRWAGKFAVWFLVLIVPFASRAGWATPQWREASTDHFLIYADAPEKWLRGFAERLEKFDSGMRYLHGMEAATPGSSNRLVIFVLENGTAVEKLCGSRCVNVRGLYVPHVGGSVAFTPRSVSGGSSFNLTPEIVLLHEYTHHFLLANSSAAHPRWLSEGFAEFNSTAEEARDGSMCFGRAAQHRAYALTSGEVSLPIERVLDPGSRTLTARELDYFYGRSWLLTHYLTFEPGRGGQLAAYLEAFNNGKSSLDAASMAFGDLRKLDNELRSYVRRGALSCFKIKPDHLSVGTITMRLLSAGEAAMLPLRMRSDRGVNKEQAQALVPEGRNAAKAFPDDPGAQTALATIEYDAGNLGEAEAAADRALAADSKLIRALLYKGQIAMRRLRNAGSDDAEAWNQARGWLVKANALDSDDAETLYLFFRSFVEQGLQPNDNAAAALRRAFKLSPQDDGLRWTYIDYLLRNDRTADARKILMPLAQAPHQSGNNRALKMMQAIDAGAAGVGVFDVVTDAVPDAAQ